MSNKSEYKRFVLPNLRVLVGCAGFGGVIGGGICLYMYRRLQTQYHNIPFHNRSLSLLKSNSMAMELIGPPIKLLGVDPGDKRSNYIDPHGNGRLKIPIEGKKLAGDLLVWATEQKPDGWTVDRLEFKVKDKNNPKTFIVYDKVTVEKNQHKVELQMDL